MGGRTLKRRRYLEVWAWHAHWAEFCQLTTHKPVRVSNSGETPEWECPKDDEIGLCMRVFRRLAGQTLTKGAAPIKVRIPKWTVIKGKP